MSHSLFRSRHAFQILLVSCVALAAGTAYAETPPSRAALLDLARGFVDRVGGGFDRADSYLATILPDDMRAQEEFADIPDGEPLLLKITLGNTPLSDTIYGIKQGRDVMLSLTDFITVARFAINVRADEGVADGWFIRESQRFSLNVATGEVTAGDRSYNAGPADVLVEAGDILVRGQALAEWLDFDLKLSFTNQVAQIESSQKWPVESQIERRNRRKPSRLAPPHLPRGHVEYTLASVPNIDLDVQQGYRRSGATGKGEATTNYSLTGAGDLLGHTATSVVTGDKEDKLRSARLTFEKESEKPDLLGPLGARKYEFGDISPSRVPVAGSARSGLGVRATSGIGNITSSATTRIEGTAMPGWDVEISRNGLVMGLVTVESDGRYIFDDVPLNAGDNEFIITQYGPQGEEREERRRVVSTANLGGGDKSAYDVSVTLADTETWLKDDTKTLDEGNPQFSGLYEMQISPEMTASAGVRSVTQNDDRKDYVHAGLSRSFGGFLMNFNSAYDMDGAAAADLQGRVNLFEQALGGTVSYVGENYSALHDATSPASYRVGTTAGGRIYDSENVQIGYDAKSEYTFVDDGSKSFDSALNVNAAFRRISLGQSISNSRAQDSSGNDDKAVRGSTSVRGSILGTRVRGVANYQIKPEYEMQNYGLDLTRRLSKDIRGNLRFEHQPEERYTEGRASLNWNMGVASLSPSVTYDTDNNLGAFVNLRMSGTHDPETEKTVFTGRNLRSSGGFSAFVYLDKNGDKVFTEGTDEPIQDATIRAVQSNQLALTDENGEAFLHDLPSGRATDLIVDENSLPDPFWIPAYEGLSMLPRPGYKAHAEFPIHIAGEIDGTLRVKRIDGSTAPLRGVTLFLYNNEGRRVQETVSAVDGFYLFDRVPPGKYLLTINDDDAKRYKIGRPQPQVVEIGYEGTTIYGNDIMVEGGSTDVPVGFAATLEDYMAANPHVSPADIAGGTVLLNLGSYRSQMLMGLVWYKIRARYAGIVGGGRLLVPPSQSYATPKTGLHELLVVMPGIGIEEAFSRCRQLAARGMVCGVEIVPGQGVKAAQAQGVGGVVN